MKSWVLQAWIVSTTSVVVLASCSGTPTTLPATSQPKQPLVDAHTALQSATPAPAMPSASSTSSNPEAPFVTDFEVVLDATTLAATTDSTFDLVPIAEGLLVVRSMPAGAFLIGSDGSTKALPDVFKGLRSPAAEWPAMEFGLRNVQGSLHDLSFTMYAPSTGEEREVRGQAGKWKVSKATPPQPKWVDANVVSPPVATKKGAKLFERAAGYQSPASEGFRFEFDGPSKGEKLPVPAKGTNGCKYRLLGHPFLEVLPDGTLLGLGTVCTSGDDVVSTGLLKGVGWPYQMLLPRIGRGQLAAEHWKQGASTVDLLPGAEHVALFAGVWMSVQSERDVVVASQVEGQTRTQAYVARFDGSQWSDITPPNPPEWLTPYRTKSGQLLILSTNGSYRRTERGWEEIRIAMEGKEDPCLDAGMYTFIETDPDQDLYLGGILRCIWRLPKGGTVAERLRLPKDADLQSMAALGGSLYVVVRQDLQSAVLRRQP